ncbi:MAG: [Alphaproteobacteria bacterium]|nr:[FeFe] hydrogenase H-cluster radical SAM maturase HydE [Alphaproteobacteria bacterium]
MQKENTHNWRDLLAKAEETGELNHSELLSLLLCDAANKEIFAVADRVREKYVGNEVHLRALIEFSNYCKNNCLYCGIRRGNLHAKRYRLSPEQIIALAQKAKECGYQTIVLQSGEDAYYDIAKMQIIIKEIKKFSVAVTLSIGEKTAEEYQAYKEAGADRFLLRIETTDKELYHRLDPNMSWEQRRKCLTYLKDAGYEVGTGSLIGLPKQTRESLADDILFFKEIGADMIGIGPFIPHPDTPLAKEAGGSFELALKVMALTRILLKDINIPATTAMEALDPNGKILALQSGANVIMPNLTDGEYGKLYDLYPGKHSDTSAPEKYRQELQKQLQKIGRSIASGQGFHGEFRKNLQKT